MPNQQDSDTQGLSSTPLKWLWVSFVVIIIDQITKWTAVGSLEEAQVHDKDKLLQQIVPVTDYLNLALAYNKGAAFGFLNDQGGWQRWFFVGLTVVVCIAILIFLKKLNEDHKWTAIGLASVMGGAVGNNLIDRPLQGKVTDFIDVYTNWDLFFLSRWADGFYHFATFNVADIAITVGAIILVIGSFFYTEE